MKKRTHLLGCLILLLAIMIITGSYAAASEKVFSDVPENHWAERYIARMSLMGIIEGYDDGSYGINQPVSRFETVTTIIRVMGLEAQSAGKNIPASFQYPASVPEWAKKYVAMGVIQEVISGDDLVSFRGGEPVKRYEVAEFIGKAMGFAEIADLHALDDLPYNDEEDIPDHAIGYISLLKTNGLMEGNENGLFRPLANVTRGEMAALMAKLDNKMAKFPDKKIKGTVSQVTMSTVTVKTDDGYETLTVGEDCFIFNNDGKGALEDILPSDELLAVRDGFKAQLLDVNTSSPTPNLSGKVSGNVLSINYDLELEISISNDGEERQTFSISDDCIIERDGNEVLLKDILPGDKVEMVIKEGQAREIAAEPVDGKIEGKIKQVLIRDKALLTMVDGNDQEHTYQIKSDTRIKKDGVTVTLLELEAGDDVELSWESNFATKIYAKTREKEQISGKVIKVNTDLSLLVISSDDGDQDERDTVFALDSTKIVTLDGNVSSRLSKVKTGDRVIVVGDVDNKVIMAQTIIILGTVK